MTIQYVTLDRKKFAMVDMKGAQDLMDYLEDLEDSLEALRRTARKEPHIASDVVKKEMWQNRIAVARARKGLTQKELSKRLKTSQAYVSKLENPAHRPSLKTLKKVAAILRVELEELI